jgi:hypothetical protein
MGWLDNYRYSQGLKKLVKTSAPPRKRKFLNYENSMTVGLLYVIKDVDQHDTIAQYIKHLKENEGMKDVLALGFWDGTEEVPEFLQARRNFDFFLRKEVNKHHQPIGNAVKEFDAKEFDILIDLSGTESLPLLFALRDSAARFKVGFPGTYRNRFLDLIMEVDQKKSLRESIEQVNYYLTIINKRAATA